MVTTKEFIPLTHITSITQHADWGFLQVKIVEGKQQKYWKPWKKKMEEKRKQLQLFHQNRMKKSKVGKDKKGESVSSVSLSENK